MKEKINCTREQADALAQKFGISQETVDKFEYKPEPKQTSLITKEDDERNNVVGGMDVNRLRTIIERIERLEEEKKGISSDIRDVYAEAKGAGFDNKIMREIIKLRRMNTADRDEQEFLLETYRKALNV